jgi:diguanylate cyclase (GGDEF)-like protein/PAS domain S-box-containing protein
VVENSSEIVTVVDSDGTLRYANPAWGRTLGHDPDEAIGTMNVLDHVHPDDLPHVLEETGKALSEGGIATNEVEYRFRCKDGSWRWMQSVGTYLLEDPAVGGVVVTSRDVTERKEAQERLRETERRLSTLLSNTPAMVYRCLNEPDWPEEYVSDYSLELTGYPASAFMDNPTLFGSLINEKDRQRIWDEVQAAVHRGVRFRLRYAIHHKDGGLRFVEELGQGVYDEFGRVVALEGLIYDVTEREQAEERLREAEERYRTLVERVPAIVYVQEAAEPSRTTYVSPQNEAILGYPPDECLADPEHWIRIMHPDDRGRVLEEDRRTNGSGDSFAMEYRQFAKDGRLVWLRDEATLVRGEGGEPLYWLGVQTDVTERKEAEEAVRRSEERLRSLADAAFEGILISDEGEILEANRALTDMFRCSLAELVGRSALEFVAPEHRDLVRRKIAFGAEDPYEIIGVRKDGTLLDLEVRGRAYSYRGRSVRVTAVRDVTERKAAEDRLRETEERYRTLVERIPAVTFVDRADGSEQNLYVSPQIESMLGYTPEEWTAGRLWRERLHPADRDRVLVSDERFEVRGEPVDLEYRLLAKDGSVVWVHEETVLVRDEAGEPQFVQGIMSDVTEKKHSEERLHYLAFHDALTGLPNRRLFVDRLGHALGRTRRRKGRRVAVLFMDLDGFKVVNDSLGHDVGDGLLVEVARRLEGCLRPEDTLARFGGDEFVALIEDLQTADDAVRVAERITNELRKPFALGGREMYVAASIGVGLGRGTRNPEELLREADTAMYRAKDEGCNYCVFDPAMHDRAVNRLELENDLRRAMEEDEFVVHYQPIVDLQTGKLWGFEALVRWEHPQRGLLNPDEFVPVAEESGLVLPMGELVLGEACRRAVEWQREFPRTPPLAMSVNLSGRQLRRPDLHEVVGQALAETGLPATSLGLDITETVYVSVLDANTASLDRLRALGIRVSLDDFGSGYSSLSYLKRLPADILKVDKSFTRGLGVEVEDTAIVQTIVDLAHIMGMEVVAEGVKIEEQETLLKEMGCDLAQGYHFSKPLPPEAASEFLKSAQRDAAHRNGSDSLSAN